MIAESLHTPSVLITGAAGNLGSLLARHLVSTVRDLRLMVHRTPVAPDLAAAGNVTVVHADLGRPETLAPAVKGADVVVHFAGVLFAPRPERFLPTTNAGWFSNLLDACIGEGVGRVVLVSFPHVEGPTTPDAPATGRLDGLPVSAHATTRLAEERMLIERTVGTGTAPVILRLGMVYGRGILMVDAARWLARRRLLGVWKEPTWIHLVSTPDYLTATSAAALEAGVEGIYQVGDEKPVTLQQFLDEACRAWNVPGPWRMPLWMIYAAATVCEAFAFVTDSAAPLTRDFVTIGRLSYVADTRRAREQLIPTLAYPTLETGIELLRD